MDELKCNLVNTGEMCRDKEEEDRSKVTPRGNAGDVTIISSASLLSKFLINSGGSGGVSLIREVLSTGTAVTCGNHEAHRNCILLEKNRLRVRRFASIFSAISHSTIFTRFYFMYFQGKYTFTSFLVYPSCLLLIYTTEIISNRLYSR